MSTSADTIRRWLANAPADTAYMFVMCDTFDYDDYPVYIDEKANVSDEIKARDGINMQKLMEVYDLAEDWEVQLNPANRANI